MSSWIKDDREYDERVIGVFPLTRANLEYFSLANLRSYPLFCRKSPDKQDYSEIGEVTFSKYLIVDRQIIVFGTAMVKGEFIDEFEKIYSRIFRPFTPYVPAVTYKTNRVVPDIMDFSAVYLKEPEFHAFTEEDAIVLAERNVFLQESRLK